MTDATAASRRSPVLPIAALCLLYAALLYAAGLHLVPWTDEAQFADPGANLHFSRRFVSTMWPYQTHEDVFLGNAPLYPFLLGYWFDLFGFGATQARALSWLFGVAGLCAVGWAAHAAGIVPRRALLWLLALFASGYGLIYATTSARYDTLGLLFVALLLRTMVGSATPWKVMLRPLVLVLIPFAGFHVAVLVGLILIVRLMLFGRDRRAFLIDCAWLGVGVGLLLLTALVFGDLKRFVVITLFSAHTVAGQIGRAIAAKGPGLGGTFAHVAGVAYRDPSYTILSLITLVLWWAGRRAGHRYDRIDAALAAGAVLFPIALAILGKYPIYYSWIGWGCLCALFVRFVCQHLATGAQLGRIALIGAVLVGLTGPVAFAAACLSFSAVSHREAEDIHSQVQDLIAPNDIVYADMSAYFDARARARYVYAFTYANNHFLPGFPTAAPVTKLIVQAGEAPNIQSLLGPEGWELEWHAARPLASDQKPLEIWRRSTAQATR